ncbi:MAG: orotidine-5'-phosphate decarboxylase [Oscillospiraceae bacterium]|nr:orotidine-5'-phosphate decarboxylase [Oscillospiraceae bacterium]
MAFDKLQDGILRMRNPTVFGLDPKPDYIPSHIMEKHISEDGLSLQTVAEAYLEFNRGLIDALCDVAPAVKPQSAYYEALGSAGVWCLEQTARYAAHKGLYTIADVKRGDIGTTAEAYSAAYLGRFGLGGGSTVEPFGFDAVTVNAYLGSDGLKPFLKTCRENDKAFFALVKTSNPSSGELQDRTFSDGRTLYETVGDLLAEITEGERDRYGYSRVGAVVGATYPEELAKLRRRLTSIFFLVPGYGAQGGSAADAAHAFGKNGTGAVINSSRAIMCAWKKTGNDGRDYMEAARAEAVRMRDDLRAAIGL